MAPGELKKKKLGNAANKFSECYMECLQNAWKVFLDGTYMSKLTARMVRARDAAILARGCDFKE